MPLRIRQNGLIPHIKLFAVKLVTVLETETRILELN